MFPLFFECFDHTVRTAGHDAIAGCCLTNGLVVKAVDPQGIETDNGMQTTVGCYPYGMASELSFGTLAVTNARVRVGGWQILIQTAAFHDVQALQASADT